MRILIPLLIFMISGVIGHYLVLTGIPGFIMGKAHQSFESEGIAESVWVQSPRQTPQTQRIVRPSPDVAYAVCRFDTTAGPVFINAPTWGGYGSLSIFDDKTNNVFVADLSANSDFDGIEIRRPAENTNAGALTLDGRGVALIRRLAPTQAEFDQAVRLNDDAICQPL